jgi:isopenicillin N synthase-like dioxygenase
MAFKEIPVLDLSEARTVETKPQFLEKLRDALLNVGFLYIKNVGIDQDTYDKVRDATVVANCSAFVDQSAGL